MGKAEIELKGEIGAGQEPGDADSHRFHRLPVDLLFCDQTGAVAVPKTGTTGKKCVLVGNPSVGMEGNRRNIQFIRLTAPVQGFDVLQNMGEFMAAEIHKVFGHGVKHERVVRVGAMA